MSNLRELYQATIIDHGKNPRNFSKILHPTCWAEGYNPLCGDKLMLYLEIEHDIIKGATFQGNGCAISMASASLMTEQLKGKTINEVKHLFSVVHIMLTEGTPADDKNSSAMLGKLTVLAGVKDFPGRVKCATLAWHALLEALKKSNLN